VRGRGRRRRRRRLALAARLRGPLRQRPVILGARGRVDQVLLRLRARGGWVG